MSPLIFGKVCRSWREIAWSAPRLWTLLQVNLNKVTDFHATLANEWLLRSMDQPLAICVTWVAGDKPVSESACIAIMGTIAKCSHRWQELKLRLPDFCYDILNHIRNHLPILRFISIDRGMEESGPEMRMFDAAPQLRVAQIRGMYLNRILLPMDQLTSLSICCGDVDECLEMLQQSPHVIHCAFGNICVSHNDPGPVHVHASQLEVLELIDVIELCSDAADVALEHLTAPAIRKISWHAYRYLPNKTSLHHHEFISFIHRSLCSLESLSLDGLCLSSDNDLIECLQAVPSLTALSLTEVDITNNVFQMLELHYWPDMPLHTLLPNLKSLKYSGNLRLDFSVIAGLLRSRWEVGQAWDLMSNGCTTARLQSVVIESDAEGVPDDHTLDLLKQLMKEGMELSLVTSDGKWA